MSGCTMLVPLSSHFESLTFDAKILPWASYASHVGINAATWAGSVGRPAWAKPGWPKYWRVMVTGPLEAEPPPLPEFFLLQAAAPSTRLAASATAATLRRRRELTIILTPLWVA